MAVQCDGFNSIPSCCCCGGSIPVPVPIYKMAGSLPRLCASSQVLTRRWNVMMRGPRRSSGNNSSSKSGSNRVVAAQDNCSKKRVVEERWRNFFSDPFQWWDHRLGKTSARYPDFKHKETGEGLWVHDNANPKWVKAELAVAAPPGTVPLPNVFWNKKLARYVREGENQKALELFQQMQHDGRSLSTFSVVPALQACARLRTLAKGREIHAQIMHLGWETDPYVGTGLVDMYGKCGSSVDARRVFNRMPTKDVILWTAMIGGYVKCGLGRKALDLYEQMKLEEPGLDPVPATFVGVLNACASLMALEEGKLVHAEVIRRGFESDAFVGSSLVDMYAKCGDIQEAQRVFDELGRHNINNVVCWTALITGYSRYGQGRKALDLYNELMELKEEEMEMEPVPVTFVGALNACAGLGALHEGRRVHEQVIKSGCEGNVFVGTSLVDMYAKCGRTDEARRVFDGLATKNVASWNAMLSGYVKCGQDRWALELYHQMREEEEGVEPVPTTFVAVLSACTNLHLLEEGKLVHAHVIQSRCDSSVFVGSSLVNMYAKCGSIEDAWSVFSKMPTWDAAAWTAMIMGYVSCGQGQKALSLYFQMQLVGVEPAPDTFFWVLRACTREAMRTLKGDVNARAIS